METRCWVILVASFCLVQLTFQATSKNTDGGINGVDPDAVQALLAKYLHRRLQVGSNQLSTPPPASVLFAANQRQREKARQVLKGKNDLSSSSTSVRDEIDRIKVNEKELANEKQRDQNQYDDDDYPDDLQGFEDSERSRTRIDLLDESPRSGIKGTLTKFSSIRANVSRAPSSTPKATL